MWFRIQSEGFITTAQTGGDIPPNWGHQSSCCCVLSSVQIAPFFFNLFTFPSLSLSLPTPPTSLVLPLSLSFSPSLSLSLSLGSALISSRQQAPLVCISSGGAVQERPRVTVRQGERGREGERERERESGSRRTRLMLHHGAASRHLGPSFFPMSTSVSLTGLIWALIS